MPRQLAPQAPARAFAICSISGIQVARQVRDDPELTFDEHELRAVMHLVLFGAQQHFEAALANRASSTVVDHLIGQSLVRQPFEKGREAFAVFGQQGDNLRFRARRALFGLHGLAEAEEVEAHHVHRARVVHLHPQHRGGESDVREHPADRARTVGGNVIVFVFRDVLRDLDGVLADGSEAGSELLGTVTEHGGLLGSAAAVYRGGGEPRGSRSVLLRARQSAYGSRAAARFRSAVARSASSCPARQR